MGTKLGKSTYPAGHGPDDFQCFGPPATQDGQFEAAKIADMGCFMQDGKDSNKYYHAAIVQSRKTKDWFVYFEWGRTGATRPDFQFVGCSGEPDAQEEFSAQLHSKNDKRGEWATIAGLRTLRAKAGKDCYLVRPMATRTTGLPDAKTIKVNDGAKASAAPAAPTAAKGKPAKPKVQVDPQTLALMRDLNVATLAFARGQSATNSLPTQAVIDDGRQILDAAMKRLIKVGDDLDDQVHDKDMTDLTNVLYGKIGKLKPVGAGPETWVLSKGNILEWQKNLDAFEAALYGATQDVQVQDDPFGGMNIHMTWLAPGTPLGDFVRRWAPRATRNVHGHIGDMKIYNAWSITRPGEEPAFRSCQDAIAREAQARERALHQPRGRTDVADRSAVYEKSNTAFLFHGTRSVNCSGILRKSLLLPKQLVGVAISGAMFGGGLYFSDDWKKSAGYTSLRGSIWSGGGGSVRGRHAFMFLVDTVLGTPYVAPGPSGYTAPPRGCHCVFGKAGHSQVQNNEWIVYKTEQHLLRYLIEFEA